MGDDVIDRKWVARDLPGGIYCAPRCGGGCTKADYRRAVKESAALATRMGDGWEPDVWENLGWHYKVTKGVAEIWPSIDHRFQRNAITGYTVSLNSAKQFVVTAETPEDALGFAVQDARTAERRIVDDLAALLEPSP